MGGVRLAFGQEVADLGEEEFFLRGGWWLRRSRRCFGFLHELVHGADEEEEEDGSGDEKGADGVDDDADIKDPELEGDIGVATDVVDDGVDDASGDGLDDFPECGTDDYADG